MTPKLINFCLYQAGWFCCVLGAAYDHPWWGTFAGLTLLLTHLALLPRRAGELRLLLAAGSLGGLVDSLQSCAGLLEFRSGTWFGCLAPAWIVLLWMQFATLLRFGLSFLLGRYALGAALAAVGGPLAFWIGSRLGAVEFASPVGRSMIVLGMVWAVSFALLLWYGGRVIEPSSVGRYRGFARHAHDRGTEA